ncbi:hypothetical protein [Methylosinus sp. Sm6]|uniref:hypothetical protein n=1 Tax=Methylosinus sp. Sm6 TaxID=2866948 RepID=UPI001C99C3C4|nr:hypothetical protein [Methylosinus sp. Sm6]MBY6243743.1 hypothetical protein [Methylosinus sp. Sm6]
MSYIAQELREARRQNVRINRRLALSELEGVVAERDEQTWKVRLSLGEDPATGETILSPWVATLSGQSGAYRVSSPLPSIGDRMRLISPSGVVGAASYAMPGTFDDELRRPDGQGAGEAVSEHGKTRVSQTASDIVAKTEKTRIAQTGDKIAIEADEPTLKGKTTRLAADSIGQLKLRLGGQTFALRPEALVPTSD